MNTLGKILSYIIDSSNSDENILLVLITFIIFIGEVYFLFPIPIEVMIGFLIADAAIVLFISIVVKELFKK